MPAVLFIIIPILAYLLIAVGGVLPFAAFMKNREVPEPVWANNNSTTYELEFTKRQESVRDFWDVVMIFCWAWPIELLAAFLWSVYKVGLNGVKALINVSTKRSGEVQDRKILIKLEAERDKLNAKSELTSLDERRLASLESLISNTKTQPEKLALTGVSFRS